MDVFMGSLILFTLFHFTTGLLRYTATLTNIEMTVLNNSYITGLNYTYKKANRTSPYVLNAEFHPVVQWDENVEMMVTIYEWRSNEFRESWSHKMSYCTAIIKDDLIFPIIKKFSNLPKKCPADKDFEKFEIKNLLMSAQGLPPLLPTGYWRLNFRFANKTDGILECKLYAKIQEIIRAKHRSNKPNQKQ